MTTPSANEVTQLLLAWSDGDKEASEKLTPLVYRELRRLAQRYMSRERREHTLQTIALVNELYVMSELDCNGRPVEFCQAKTRELLIIRSLLVFQDRNRDGLAKF